MRTAYGEALLELGETHPGVVVLGADTTESIKSGMFGAKFPERFFNLGIAEQNLVGVAAGLALAGKTAYAGTYAIFVPGKCVDQIRNIIAYANLDVKLICSHGGISVGPDGASHQQLEDIAIIHAIPKMRVVVPSDAVSVKGIVKSIADIPGPFYVRITRGMVKGSSVPTIYDEGFDYKLGKANLLRDGSDVRDLRLWGDGRGSTPGGRVPRGEGDQRGRDRLAHGEADRRGAGPEIRKAVRVDRHRRGAQRAWRAGVGHLRGRHRGPSREGHQGGSQGQVRGERRGPGALQQVRPDRREDRGSGDDREKALGLTAGLAPKNPTNEPPRLKSGRLTALASLADSRFDFLSSFLRKRYKLVLVAWIVALVVFGTQIPTFFGAVSYNVAGSNFGGPSNAESQLAQNIIHAQFPSASSNGGNGIIVVLQNDQMYSSSVQSALIGLNKTLASDQAFGGAFAGMSSIYSTGRLVPGLGHPYAHPPGSELNASLASKTGQGTGSSPATTWDIASSLVANTTAASFASSPLFTARAPDSRRSWPRSARGSAPCKSRPG